MTTKSYSKHKEFKEFSSSSGGNAPFAGEQFDMLKSELIPANSKLNNIGNGGHREYHYEYREEKLPHGKYDRKDLHTVEEYTIPPKTLPKSDASSYYYEREERDLPAITSGTRTYNYESNTSSTPGYSKVKSSKVTKDLSHNVEELDSLLDDLQKDQERQLYKSGYTSDTAESTSFDYKRGTPVKAPSSGYSTLKREERVESSSWGSSPPPPTTTRAAEIRQEMYREEKTESRVVPQVVPAPAPAPIQTCTHCHHQTSSTGTLSRSSTPMNKVTTTVKTYTYEVPADQDPTTVPIPTHDSHTYVSDTENVRTLSRTTTAGAPAAPPPGGCQYCQHCNTSTRVRRDQYSATDVSEHTTERMVYPSPANEVKLLPSNPPAPVTTHLTPERNGHGPYGPSTYKYSETTYSRHDTTERATPSPFPRPSTPSQRDQQPPKRLDDLLADFPEARFPVSQPDGVVRRKVEVSHETRQASSPPPTPTAKAPAVGSKNVAGPAVYYPPGHTPFAKKDAPIAYTAGGSASAAQGGGAYASGRGMYEYESGSRSKEKHSEKKTAVPICLPLCCAMPCVIM